MRSKRIIHIVESLVKAYKLHGRPVTRVEVSKVASVARQTVGLAIGSKFPGIEICQRPMRVGTRDTRPWTYRPLPKTIRAIEEGTYELPTSKLPKPLPPKEMGKPRSLSEKPNTRTLAGRLKACRLDSKLSQRAWAELIGCSINTVYSNEKGLAVPLATFLNAYAEQGYNVNWILMGKGEMRLSDSL